MLTAHWPSRETALTGNGFAGLGTAYMGLGFDGPLFTSLADPKNPSLPPYVLDAIREALPAFDRQIKGFAMPDAVLTGVETRTSSPVRVKRGDDFQSINIKGLYPAGRGATGRT